MKRFITLLVALFSLVCVSAVLAQSSVPFRGTVDMPTVMAGKDTVVYRPMGLGSIREGVADLQHRVGELSDQVSSVKYTVDRIDGRATNPSTKSDEGLVPWWWLLVVALLAWMLGRASRSSDHDEAHGGMGGAGGQINVNSPLVPPPTVAKTSDGKDIPIANIPAIPGTSFRVEREEPTERTIHRIEEVRMDPNTADAFVTVMEGFIELIGRSAPKPGKPATPPADPPAAS